MYAVGVRKITSSVAEADVRYLQSPAALGPDKAYQGASIAPMNGLWMPLGPSQLTVNGHPRAHVVRRCTKKRGLGGRRGCEVSTHPTSPPASGLTEPTKTR